MEIEARHLRTILSMAREGSISQASRALHLTQPALSTQLGRIERSLGHVLFERSPTGVSLTRAGEVAAHHSERILEHFRLLGSLPSRVPGAGPPLRVGGNVPGSLGALAGELVAQLPERSIVPRPEAAAPVVDRMLHSARLDLALLAVAPGPDAVPPRGVRQQTLVASDPLLVAVAADSPLAARHDIGFEDLVDVPWLLPAGQGGGLYDALLACFTRAGYSPLTPLAPCTAGDVLEFVARGLGVGVVPSTLAVRDGVTLLPIRGKPLVGRRVLRWRPESVSAHEARVALWLAARVFVESVAQVAMRQRWWDAHASYRPVMSLPFTHLLAEAEQRGR